jgi:hypothetical protein
MKQISLREMLLLFVIFGLALGWWLDRRLGPPRFQLSVSGDHAIIMDNATGQLWDEFVDVIPKRNRTQETLK